MDTRRIAQKLSHTKWKKAVAAQHFPLFKDRYYVGITEDRTMYLFAESEDGFRYERTLDAGQTIPVGTRAAFPIDGVDDCVCIVTPECLDEPTGHITLMHEMVHCFQFRACEMQLRETLSIQRLANERQDFMWELNHQFPYEDRQFGHFIESIADAGVASAIDLMRGLRARLSVVDYEYMIWQMWKEGFARFVENRVREGEGVDQTDMGNPSERRDRVSLYYAGDYFWRLIEMQDASAIEDIKAAFAYFDP